ncbi:MAG TPA: heparan-alpha-glucosaminide N-acetyltransferase domain-containing protein [Terriglobales bacterium]|jgi:uncharacterized membrane protein
MASAPSSRLVYIDWLRGLACVLMFQTHGYDAWLGGAARNSKFLMYSQLGGTFPAPLFLFLAGVSFAIVTDKLVQKGLTANEIAKKTIRRGAEIFALGILFRLQEFVIALGWAPWSDLFRVDILNTIGASMMLMGVTCWVVNSLGERRGATGALARQASLKLRMILPALVVSAAIALTTPLFWTTWHPRFLPWELETYINGVHNLGQPQAGLFPLFPWAGFAFAGLAFGFVLTSDVAQKLGWRLFAIGGVAGVAFYYMAKFCDARSWQIYPVFDFWHTSPEFFLMRVGFLLLFVLGAYAWCRWGFGQKGFSPLIQLGNTSLLVYWVHIELVYGKFAILPHRSQGIAGASTGLLIIFLMMLALSALRTGWKSHSGEILRWMVKRQAQNT